MLAHGASLAERRVVPSSNEKVIYQVHSERVNVENKGVVPSSKWAERQELMREKRKRRPSGRRLRNSASEKKGDGKQEDDEEPTLPRREN